jgi:hypothetical protein
MLMDKAELNNYEMKECNINYIFIYCHKKSKEELSKLIENVIELGLNNSMVIGEILGPMVSMYYGHLPDDPTDSRRRKELISNLQDSFGGDISIIHGSQNTGVGIYGGNHRNTFGVLYKDLNNILGKLCELKPGETSEITA